MAVTAVFKQLKIVCIHPRHTSYPIFSIVLQEKRLRYLSKFDHDEMQVQMGNLEIIDHTCYPKTLDPFKQYTSRDQLQSQKILSRRSLVHNDHMLDMEMVMFHYPLERTCHLARKPEYESYDKHVRIELKSMKLLFLMEYLYRVQDYFFY